MAIDYPSAKSGVKLFYDRFATRYESGQLAIPPEVYEFCNRLQRGAMVLDLGSGPGLNALAMMNAGIRPICVDVSEEMCKLVRARSILALHADMEALLLPFGTFDGVFARNSLLHLPRESMPAMLRKIHAALRFGGLLFLSVKEGEGEEMKVTENGETFYSYWGLDELRQHIEAAGFLDVRVSRTASKDTFGERHYLCVFAKK